VRRLTLGQGRGEHCTSVWMTFKLSEHAVRS
jgi:hypothetical protein